MKRRLGAYLAYLSTAAAFSTLLLVASLAQAAFVTTNEAGMDAIFVSGK